MPGVMDAKTLNVVAWIHRVPAGLLKFEVLVLGGSLRVSIG